MNNPKRKKSFHNQQGAALLIAIFSLLLISAVAIALILMAGTESAISGNYKSSLKAFYNAKAGIEEGRGRLWGGNANPLSASSFPAFLQGGQVWYIINPGSGETVDPKTAGTKYADPEYASSWFSSTTTVKPYVNSVTSLSGTANAPYKWVRITATTEKSLGIDVDGNGGGLDNTTELCFDGTQLLPSVTVSGVKGCSNGAYQVFTVASLAVTPGIHSGQRIE